MIVLKVVEACYYDTLHSSRFWVSRGT